MANFSEIEAEYIFKLKIIFKCLKYSADWTAQQMLIDLHSFQHL